ncbi:DNA adenine methylase [Aestuariibius insulae]|uniref:DNA adenine methylase n=1 Tax=Aestuariibius insulae TaxID=2058287 RepID=UPI00345EA13E
MRQVPAAKPVAPWLGGKKMLSNLIIEKIDAIDHATYVEPFVGMGGVFLRRTWKPKCEVANDINGEITNLFRILQRHYPQLIEVMRFQITSRAEFERLRKCDPSTLTDLERAARFLYLQRLAFGGQLGGVFGVAPDRPSRFSLSRLEPLLEAAHARLEDVIFENLDWRAILERYDGRKTLFYIDPPYWGHEADYGRGLFDKRDIREMADRLSKIDGTFLLSMNDTPEVRRLFDGFHFEEARLTYTISKHEAKAAPELIVCNREISVGLL